MSVEINIDKQSFDRLQSQLTKMQVEGGRSAYSALVKAAMAIKAEAQLRLTGRGHIITSRLKNSINIMIGGQQKANNTSYSDLTGKSYDGSLKTVTLSADEIAVGTNVEYGPYVEYKDSYLYWALKNVNVEQLLAEKMREDFSRFTR